MSGTNNNLHQLPTQDQDHEPDPNSKAKIAPEKAGSKMLVFAKLLLPLLILAVAVGSYNYLKTTKSKPKKPQLVEKVWPVEALAATPTSHTPTLRLYGKTVSSRRVDLRALVSGKIIEVSNELKEGALIKKDEQLLKIDDFDYKGALVEAKANLKEAKAREAELKANIELEKENLKYAEDQLALARKDFARADELSKRGTVTKKLADDRNVIVSQRAQAVATTRVNLDLQSARQAQQAAVIDRLNWKVTQAERRLKETSLIAPFDAYVSAVNAEIGRTVSANDTIATLIDQKKIDVRFTLTDAQYGRILTHDKTLNGRSVKVKWNVGEKPVEYQATIVRTGAIIASQTGGVEVYAEVKDATKPVPLRSGAFVVVSIADREYLNVYRLPQTALYNGNNIYVIKDDRLTRRAVEIVGASGSDTLIRANIADGEKILLTRLTLAGDGVKVRIFNQDNNGAGDKKSVSQKSTGKAPASVKAKLDKPVAKGL